MAENEARSPRASLSPDSAKRKAEEGQQPPLKAAKKTRAPQGRDMYSTPIDFVVHEPSGKTTRSIGFSDLIIAGWTGRDPVARDHHIAELEAIGIARPASTSGSIRVASTARRCGRTCICSSGYRSCRSRPTGWANTRTTRCRLPSTA